MNKQEDTRDRILDLIEGLDVGASIPSERQLTGDLGVSRLRMSWFATAISSAVTAVAPTSPNPRSPNR